MVCKKKCVNFIRYVKTGHNRLNPRQSLKLFLQAEDNTIKNRHFLAF